MISFHRLLIGTAMVFCVGMAAWLVASSRNDGNTGLLVLGVSFGLAAVALGYYLRNLDRFLRR